MRPVYDAVVIGGGPGGSTVATALSRAGRSVLLLERERFPRFHVGESLLPFALPIFDRLGVHEKIRAAGYQTKYGAFFWNESNGTTRPVVFAEARNPNHPIAYQVKRADFDDLLLRHAASCGAEVREETAVEDVLFEGRRAVGVRARPRASGGEPEEVRASVVIDASGQGALLSRKLGLRRFDPKLKRAALFAHYADLAWPDGSRPGDILLPIDQGVWYWIIPFSDGTCSVGGVFDPAEVRLPEGAPAEARYDALLARSPRVIGLLGGARRISGVHGDRPGALQAPPGRRPRPRALRKARESDVRALPEVRLQLLRPGFLRRVHEPASARRDPRRRGHDARRRRRARLAHDVVLDEADVLGRRTRPLDAEMADAGSGAGFLRAP